MDTKYIIISFFLSFIYFSSCKTDKKNTIESLIKQNNRDVSIIQEQNKYSKNILKKIEKLELEPNGGGEYKKNEKTLFIDVLEEMAIHEKHIMYILSYYDEDNDRNDEGYSYFTDNYNNITGNKKENEIIIKDTFLFKNNKIYFWKNKEATNEILLIKEKEILLIKETVNSTLLE